MFYTFMVVIKIQYLKHMDTDTGETVQQDATINTDFEHSPRENKESNNVTTTLSSFLSRYRQMPPQKQQQLVSTSAAIVRNTNGNDNNANTLLENDVVTNREEVFKVIYGFKKDKADKTASKPAEKQPMCIVVDAHERCIRIVKKEEISKLNPKFVHLEDMSEEDFTRFGIIFPDNRIEETDRFVHCDLCNRYYDFSCLEHPLYQCHDRDPSLSLQNSPSKDSDDRAAMTLPGFLYIHNSVIPNAGKGVFTKVDIPVGIVFGPYEGILFEEQKKVSQDGYAWELRTGNGKQSYYIDAKDPRYSNWMRYINSPRHESEQNLIAFQYKGSVFYRVYRPIDKNTELLVWKKLWQRARNHIVD